MDNQSDDGLGKVTEKLILGHVGSRSIRSMLSVKASWWHGLQLNRESEATKAG